MTDTPDYGELADDDDELAPEDYADTALELDPAEVDPDHTPDPDYRDDEA